MKPRIHPVLLLLLLLAVCASLATLLENQMLAAGTPRRGSGSVLQVLFGDGRRLFSNHFFIKADVSFHSGYYPTIFDRVQRPKDSRHMTVKEEDEDSGTQTNQVKHATQTGTEGGTEHERQMDFLGPPRDWIERFGRNFLITSHTHLEGGQAREILPWLRISADLDPQRVETYTVAAYWLRDLGKYKEADQFLQEGLRNNPNSYEILFELGRLYQENYHDNVRARNVWEAALRKWMVRESNKKDPDLFKLEEIALHLGRMEESDGHWQKAIEMLELAKKASPHPEVLERQIEELRRKPAAPAAGQPR